MIQRLQRRHGGFTLVEIMIVVAIIALLAAIAVPGFLRARKRAQATTILNDARVIDGAIDQWAIENNKSGDTSIASNNDALMAFLKKASRLYREWPSDILGNDYVLTNVDAGVKINTSSQDNFTDVIDNGQKFWGAYYNSGS